MHLKLETSRSAIMKSHKHSHKKHSSVGRSHFGIPRSGGKELHSQANASWETPSVKPEEEQFSSTSNIPKHRSHRSRSSQRNALLEGADIQDLLAMLKSNDFAGKVDPKHHSQYFTSPAEKLSLHGKFGLIKEQGRQTTGQGARQTPHSRSDGHLLQVN